GGNANVNPIGSIGSQFTGKFEGLGHTISNLNITGATASQNNIGLFAYIGSAGVVQNLKLENITVTANPLVPPPGQFVGVLAGENAGAIKNVTIINSTISNNGVTNGVLAGGMVGQNQNGATIANSSAAVNVTVGSSTTGSSENSAGGLVGVNLG